MRPGDFDSISLYHAGYSRGIIVAGIGGRFTSLRDLTIIGSGHLITNHSVYQCHDVAVRGDKNLKMQLSAPRLLRDEKASNPQ